MKNLFYLHSHITYYVAKGIISKLNINKNTVIFIISRNYKNQGLKEFTTVDFSNLHNNLDDFNIGNFYRKHSFISDVDKLLESFLGDEDFNAFLPHVFHPIMQIIASNRKCRAVNIMEEGVNAYSNYFMNFKDKNKIKGLIKNILNRLNFIGKKRIFFIKNFDLRRFKKETPPTFYTVTSKGFKGLEYNVEKIKMVADNNKNTYDISGKSILVLEGAVEQGNMHLATLLDGIKTILNDIDEKEVYVKFHPVQNKENRETIRSIIQIKGINVNILSDEIAFEEIILTNEDLKVYGFTTSLLFYAYEYNCHVKSYEYCLANDSLFKEFRNKNNFDLKRLLNG